MSIHWRVSEREHPQKCHFLYFLERPLQQFCTTVQTVILHSHGFLGHCLLWPWTLAFWPQNLTSTFVDPSASVTKIGWNSLHCFWDMVLTMFSDHCMLWPWPLKFFITKSNQYIYEPKYVCDQKWVKFPSLVFEIWCSQCFWVAQTHSLIHSLTHGRTAPFFNGSGCTEINEMRN